MTEVVAGILGPLVAVGVSWAVAARTYRTDPARLTGVLIAGFAAKAVFFGVYVVVVLGLFSLRPAPFAASFTVAFIALYLAEAIWLWKRQR